MDTFEHETIKLTCSNKEGSSREANTQKSACEIFIIENYKDYIKPDVQVNLNKEVVNNG